MAKPITYNKRDNEKKKQEKRIEKQKKKENRKLSGTSSFDDMIAYVDHYGQITDTPPNASQNKPRATASNENDESSHNDFANDAQKSKNKMTDLKGKVEHVNAEKGYGFIKETSQTDKYFFHVSGLLESVQVGDSVLFDLERGKKGLNALRIRKQDSDPQ